MEIYIDLKKLEFVLVVSRELNVGKAAALLKFSQSYVSRGIKEFEEQQRVTFFERNPSDPKCPFPGSSSADTATHAVRDVRFNRIRAFSGRRHIRVSRVA